MMVEIYSKAISTRNYKRDTVRRKLQHVRHYLNWASDIGDPIKDAMLFERYVTDLHSKGIAEKTILNRISSLRGFFEYLRFHRIVEEIPIDPTTRITLPETVPVFLPDDEIKLLIKLAEKEQLLVEVTLALNTGLRMNELRHLKWRDIDFDNKQVIVQGKVAKGKRPRTIPLNQMAIVVLIKQKERYTDFKYVFPGGRGGQNLRCVWDQNTMRSYTWWQKLALAPIRDKIPTIANIPKGHTCRGWHIMRHTFATRLAKAGVDLMKIKDWLGHKSINTTMRYVHLSRHYDEDIELLKL